MDSFDQHLAQPEIDILTYVRRKNVALAEEIRERTKLYLDTKYWAILRDVRLGRSNCSDTKKLLKTLETRVARGSLVCPLNADIYFEVMKQEDAQTLVETARLIDDLSLGICMMPMDQRLKLEVFYFIATTRKSKDGVHEPDELVWSKAAYVLGFATPNCYKLPGPVNIALQKYFADCMWTLGFEDQLNAMGVDNAIAKESPFKDISGQLNAGKFAHLEEHSSFKSLFLSEVRGILDVYKDEFGDLLQYIYMKDTGNRLTDAEKQDRSGGLALADLIYHAFRLDKVTQHLPSIRISAGLHAAMRWDKNRKYKPNDRFDFFHAVAAMPYCDLFFTERSLHHLIQDGNLKFDEHFLCKTVYKPADALELAETFGKK